MSAYVLTKECLCFDVDVRFKMDMTVSLVYTIYTQQSNTTFDRPKQLFALSKRVFNPRNEITEHCLCVILQNTINDNTSAVMVYKTKLDRFHGSMKNHKNRNRVNRQSARIKPTQRICTYSKFSFYSHMCPPI